MSKNKTGNKFVIEIAGKSPSFGAKDNANVLYRAKGFNALLKKEEYEKGLTDAWELARKLYCDIKAPELKEIFDYKSDHHVDASNVFRWILNELTPQQAFAKIEAYEESKAIKVGDVVVCKLDDIQGVVIDKISDEECYTYNENGCVEEHKFRYLKKTGKTVDIQRLLEQIRGNE